MKYRMLISEYCQATVTVRTSQPVTQKRPGDIPKSESFAGILIRHSQPAFRSLHHDSAGISCTPSSRRIILSLSRQSSQGLVSILFKRNKRRAM